MGISPIIRSEAILLPNDELGGSAKERERRMIDPKKQARIDEVKSLLADFSEQCLARAPDIVGYLEKLWD